ncbi:MAG: hypothetical protein ACOCWS_05325 [Alkalispirochaetaceae bacterium]
MDEEFIPRLSEALESRAEQLRNEELPDLKERFRSFQASFTSVYNVLLRKGLVQEDPYKYEHHISEIKTPDDAPFLDSERDEQMTIRLSQYQNLLDYINNYYDFSLEALTLRELKKLVRMVRYIDWQKVTNTSGSFTTRYLADLVGKLQRESDPLSVDIVDDARDQLAKQTKRILQILKHVTTYQREVYKLRVRQEVLPEASLPQRMSEAGRQQGTQKIKRAFTRKMKGEPYLGDLINEILEEDYGDEGPKRREELINTLQVKKEEQKKKEKPSDRLKPLLLEAARAIANTSRSLDQGARKLEDNCLVLENRKLTFGEVITQVLKRIFGQEERKRSFTIEYVDEATSARQTEEIAFDSFLHRVSRKSRIYAALMVRGSQSYRKLESSSEDKILQFLNKDLEELSRTIKQFDSLATFFRSEVPRDQRNQLRDLEPEIGTIKEQIALAKKKRHQYVSRMEELEQLKKLGIDNTEGY